MKPAFLVLLSAVLLSCTSGPPKSDAYGTFEATEYLIAAEGNGRILEFNIHEGSLLDSGVYVGGIDTLSLCLKRDQLLAARQAVASKFEYLRAQADIFNEQRKIALNEKQRIQTLLQSNAATTKQLDDVQGQIDVLEKQIKSVEVQNTAVMNEIRSYDAQIAQINDQIRRCYIINPVRGTVLNKYAEPHETVVYGKPLYKIADMNYLYLRVYIDGAQLPHVKTGQRVKVFIDENYRDNRELEGVVTWISSKAEFTPKIIQTKEERVNMVYAVKIRVRNEGSLKIGMPGEAVFL